MEAKSYPPFQHLLDELNPEQREAVTHGGGPLLVIAGAGTGKTKVLTHRIAYLIASKKARPEEILAVTFTEKAASEMEERVDILIPYSYSFVEISTFNSFGEKILRDYAIEVGYPSNFKLLDDVEQLIFFRENLFKFPLDYYRPLSNPTKHIEELVEVIKRLKQEDILPEEYLCYAEKLYKNAGNEIEREEAKKHLEVAKVYDTYQKLLKEQGKIDFEDQVCLVVKLFRNRPSILKEFQEKYKYILVDEFQDTNYIQFQLLQLLAGKNRNLTVVGDDDQSIYKFRGAAITNILNFMEVYPDGKKIILTKNYRSLQPILDSAYRLIQHNNPNRLEYKYKINKILEAVRKEESTSTSKPINLLLFDTLSNEADTVAKIIEEKYGQGYKYSDIAILVRKNADADPYMRALNMKQIPYRFSGSRGLYSQYEIKILISFIKSVTDFDDSKSLYYLALSEVYQTDPYDLTKISNYADKKNKSLHEVFKRIAYEKTPVKIFPETEVTVRKIYQDLEYFVKLSASESAGRVLYEFLQKTGYLKRLVEEGSARSEAKIKNMALFFQKVKNFSDLTEHDSLQSFAKYLELLQEVGDNPSTAEAELDEDAVNILTVHKAKGLEFPVVFMVSLIADRFPGRERREKIPIPKELIKENLPERENYLEEERRLFYVGMTRAKNEIFFTMAKDYGLKRLKKISPFVLETMDLPKPPDKIIKASALEEIERNAPVEEKDRAPIILEKEILTLSFFQIEDYLICPLKYKFKHILRVPILPHHTVVFGRVLHNVIHFYLKQRRAGKKISEKELLEAYNRYWINEGYLSREHEEMRYDAGKRALLMFYQREEKSFSIPTYIEKEFKWQLDSVKLIGRWDRIDFTEKGAVIIDFKATEVTNQKEADKKARENLQLDLYALAFVNTQKENLLETQLHFLESDIIGRAVKGQKEFERAMEKIRITEQGIRTQSYSPKPDWHNCQHCEYRSICPSSYAY
ncbi:ATP-dependent helicase [Candidatus Aminicenantes bacterium AH-873-B07]|nr:ATP-dependent helicase [Candidatus Aminicenantes bacterium AH-873-B07]